MVIRPAYYFLIVVACTLLGVLLSDCSAFGALLHKECRQSNYERSNIKYLVTFEPVFV